MATVILQSNVLKATRVMSNVTVIRPAIENKKEQLIEALKKNNIRYEVRPGKAYGCTYIGFQFKGKKCEWVWHWVEYLVLDLTGYTCLTFDHTYSMNTGKSKKGFSNEFAVKQRLQEATGFHNWY
jgi:hypothetical protein